MDELFERLEKRLQNGQAAVLLLVVRREGSVPRGIGARMLVTSNGCEMGTIGGGSVEYRCEKIAKKMLGSHEPYLEHFILHDREKSEMDMICGGEITVLFCPFLPYETMGLTLARSVIALQRDSRPSWLIVELTAHTQVRAYACERGQLPVELPQNLEKLFGKTAGVADVGGRQFYYEPLIQKGMLYVFGGGHVGCALARAAALVDIPVTVLDDRPEFANSERFPTAQQIIVTNYVHLDELHIAPEDMLVIVTRGHLGDADVLRWCLHQSAKYIGMIGSKRKRDAIYHTLLQEDATLACRLNQVHAPIGLNIGAETPSEIAIAILAEIIQTNAECKKEDVK